MIQVGNPHRNGGRPCRLHMVRMEGSGVRFGLASVICSVPYQSQRTRSANVGLAVLKKRRANHPFRHLLLVMSCILVTKRGMNVSCQRSGRKDRRAALQSTC
jgi:hypothetical protein